MKVLGLIILFFMLYCSSPAPTERSNGPTMIDTLKEKADSEEGKKMIQTIKEKAQDKETQEKLKSLFSKDKK